MSNLIAIARVMHGLCTGSLFYIYRERNTGYTGYTGYLLGLQNSISFLVGRSMSFEGISFCAIKHPVHPVHPVQSSFSIYLEAFRTRAAHPVHPVHPVQSRLLSYKGFYDSY